MNLEEAEKITHCKQIHDALRCMICVEYFDNPHTLECGHSYCQGCLHQWLNNKKSCPECRLPVSRPPCPSYVLQKLVDAFKPLVGITVTKTSTNGKSTAVEFWGKLFPNHNPRGYIRDQSDGVVRCASCLNELEPDGDCGHCNLQYEFDAQEDGDMGANIDLDTDMGMEHEPEDEYNESDLEFLNDGEVEYDSDIGDDIDRSSYDEDSDVPGNWDSPDYYDLSDANDFDLERDLSDSAAQLDIYDSDAGEDDDIQYSDDHSHFSEDECYLNGGYISDDSVGSGVGLMNIRRLGAPGAIEIYDSDNETDTSSSEDSDDDAADYAGLADFKDQYGTSGTPTNKNNIQAPSTSSSTKQANDEANVYLSLSENSDDAGDSNINTGNGSNKKRRVIADTDDESDEDIRIPAIETTNTSNDNGNNKGKNKASTKKTVTFDMNSETTGKNNKGKEIATKNEKPIKKKHKKKKAKKNKKLRTLV